MLRPFVVVPLTFTESSVYTKYTERFIAFLFTRKSLIKVGGISVLQKPIYRMYNKLCNCKNINKCVLINFSFFFLSILIYMRGKTIGNLDTFVPYRLFTYYKILNKLTFNKYCSNCLTITMERHLVNCLVHKSQRKHYSGIINVKLIFLQVIEQY